MILSEQDLDTVSFMEMKLDSEGHKRSVNPENMRTLKNPKFVALCGELAACRLLGLKSRTVSLNHRAEFGIIIKTVTIPNGRILYGKFDIESKMKANVPIVLVDGHKHPEYQLGGWIWSDDFKANCFYYPPASRWYPCYAVENSTLRPIDELEKLIIEWKRNRELP